jgi:adenine-specific DNA-methyltransferase
MKFKHLESETKLRGGYYTPQLLSEFLWRWISPSNPMSVLEPSSGDGAFFRTQGFQNLPSLKSLTACELDKVEAAKTVEAVQSRPDVDTEMVVDDFLAWGRLQLSRNNRFDACVGNPPFIRYQYLNAEQQMIAARIFEDNGLKFTKHTNAWVPFVLTAINLLKPGGRLAMVVPSELLSVLHSRELRRFLLRECDLVLCLEPTTNQFKDLLQGVVLLQCVKKREESHEQGKLFVSSVESTDLTSAHPCHLVENIDPVPPGFTDGKWVIGLLNESSQRLIEQVESLPNVKRFAEIASVDVGIVTGANSFFLVDDTTVEEYGLHEWARPAFGRSGNVAGVVYDLSQHERNAANGLRTNLLHFNGQPLDDLPPKVRTYLKSGEDQELHLRYKTRIRNPWYVVPSIYSTSVGMLKRSHDFPRLIFNEMEALTTDTAYRVVSTTLNPRDLVAVFVNSLTALSCELEGRSYGGGVLELVPSEIEKVLVPEFQPSNELLSSLDSMVSSGVDAAEILRTQDAAVLSAIGLSEQDRSELLDAWTLLKSRRRRHSGVKPTT